MKWIVSINARKSLAQPHLVFPPLIFPPLIFPPLILCQVSKVKFKQAISEIEKAEIALHLQPQVSCRRVGKKQRRFLFRFSRDCSPDRLLNFQEYVTSIQSGRCVK